MAAQGFAAVLERAKSLVEANLASRMTEVAAERGITGIDTTLVLYFGAPAAVFLERQTSGCGVFGFAGGTTLRTSNYRNWNFTLHLDYTYRSTDWQKVRDQVDVWIQAVLRVMDDLPGALGIEEASEVTVNRSVDRADVGGQIRVAGGYTGIGLVTMQTRSKEQLP